MKQNYKRYIPPILLILFNRIETSSRVINKLAQIEHDKIFVFMDGPRKNNSDDLASQDVIKKIVIEKFRNSDLYMNFNDFNLGCGKGPYTAISWFFENVDEGIILEDDCLPASSLIAYCAELLEKYRYDTRICGIAGANFFENIKMNDDSYFFSKFGPSWGWATWKRVWKNYDFNMSKWPLFVKGHYDFDDIINKKERAWAYKYYLNAYAQIDSIKEHVWDTQNGFLNWSNRQLGIVPAKNLVSNIGSVGTHSNQKLWYHDLSIDENFIITKHPDFILRNTIWDSYYFNNIFKKRGLGQRVLNKIIRLSNHLKVK